MDNIPKLNLSDFLNGIPSLKSKFVADLGYAYEEIGFVAIRNHGIPQSDLNALYSNVKNFFNLDTEIKLKYDDTAGGGQRGYTGFGKEHAKNRNTGDLKEFWHFGQFIDPADTNPPKLPKNKTVSEISDFNLFGEKIYKALENTGVQMLRAIALYVFEFG